MYDKKYLFLFLLVFWWFSVEAQQTGISSLYYNSSSFFNPAYTSLETKHKVNFFHRNQWTGIKGRPITSILQYEAGLPSINSSIGVNMMYETIGFYQILYPSLNFSYQIQFSEEMSLNVGVSPGFKQMKLDPSGFITPDTIPDPSLPVDIVSQTKMTFNAGFLFRWKTFHLGLSALQVNQAHYDRINYSDVIHYYLFASYQFNTQKEFSIIPQIMGAKTIGSYYLSGNIMGLYKEKYWLMLGYANSNTFQTAIGFDVFQSFGLGYSFEMVFSTLGNFTSGTHEMYLRYRVKK